MNNNKTIAIVGNGFDLVHGYNTKYEDFIKNTEAKTLDTFRSFCDGKSIDKWYEFERTIEELTSQFFQSSMSDSEDYFANRKELAKLNECFKEIHVLLEDYLNKEIAKKQLKKQSVLKKYLSPHTLAINFNYTPTVECYTDNVYYIHGSIKEHDIILGYDYRDEPCLIGYEEMQWSKELCREALEFRRYLKNKHHLDPNDEQFCRYNKGFIDYQVACHSSRGLDPDTKPEEYLPEYEFVSKYLKNEKNDITEIFKDKSFETAVIIGHSIQADEKLLKTIFSNLPSLKKVVIFRYKKEPLSSLKRKKVFFKQFCKKIVCQSYKNNEYR